MKRNRILGLIAGGTLVVVAAFAQASAPSAQSPPSAHQHQGMGMSGGSSGGMMGGMSGGMMGGAMSFDRTMMAHRQSMMTRDGAADVKLQRLVSEMKSAPAERKMDAMAAVIAELASREQDMGREMMAMQPEMMQHMMAHMGHGTFAEAVKSMSECALIRGDTGSQATGAARAEHVPGARR